MKKEMYKGMVNSPQTGISQDINESVTDIPVENGSVFPKGPNLAVIGTDQHAETIRYTSVNSNILVGCTRGFEGVAKSWDSGTPIARNITQYDIYSLQENLKEVDSNKVEKVENKGLSTEDYTTEEKEKLGGIEKGANKYTHPETHSPEIIKETEEKQFISKTEKESIKNKVDKDGEKVLSTNDYTDTDKAEVAKIKDKVDKAEGKELSTNDYTNADKAKVDAIPENPKYTDTIATKESVGLGKVKNEEQATKEELDELKAEYQEQISPSKLLTNSKNITEAINELYEVKVDKPPIYGIEIDENNSNPETSVTYIDDAEGFTPAKGNNGNFDWGSWESIIKEEFKIKPAVVKNPSGEVNYYLNYDNYNQKEEGGTSNLTGTDGDVMVEFGQELWWKFSRIGNKLKIQISTKEFDGAVKYAFEVEEGYNQLSFYPLTLLQILCLLMLKNRDTQTALGRGYVDGNSSFLNTGASNNRPFMYGETTGKQQMKFLGLEDFWGNRRQWIDGCFYDSSLNMLTGKSNFNDTGSGYANQGKAMSSGGGGYVSQVQGTDETGFIPKVFSGSATTHYADYSYLIDGQLPCFGGYRSRGSHAGGFHLNSYAASNSSSYVGARLCLYKNGKLYVGAYLGVDQSSKLRSISGKESAGSKTIGAFRTLAKANNQ